jgi:transcriptional regulator with XRE-family HTH domain
MQRTGFGRLSVELRAKKGVSQAEFARKAGIALSRVSNLEHQRTHISDDVVGIYIEVLQCTGEEAHELRKRATFSNVVRDQGPEAKDVSPLQAMLSLYGNSISPVGRARLQKVIEFALNNPIRRSRSRIGGLASARRGPGPRR